MHDLKGQGLTKDDTSSRVRLSPTTIKERTLEVAPSEARASRPPLVLCCT